MKEKRKLGRPELPVEEKMVTINFRATAEQKAKAKLLGNGKWLRRKIDQAKVKS